MNESEVNEFLICTMTALLDDFCQNLRAVQVDIKDNRLISWFYFDGEISDENEDFAGSVTCESTSDFLNRYKLQDDHIERLDYPLKIPNNGRFAYLRYEEPPAQEITCHFLGHPLEKLLNAFNKAADIPISEVFWPSRIRLLLQEALLGCIKPNLRAVSGELDELEKILYIWIYFDGEISDNDRKLMNTAINKVKIYFKNLFAVESFIDRCDRPKKIPSIGRPVFCSYRWEKSEDQDEMKDIEENILAFTDPHDYFYFMRNIQDALLGKVGSQLRSVKVEMDEMRRVLYFWFYYDGEISQRDHHNAEEVIKYVKEKFNNEYSSKDKIVRLDYPNKIPSMGWSVYECDEQK